MAIHALELCFIVCSLDVSATTIIADQTTRYDSFLCGEHGILPARVTTFIEAKAKGIVAIRLLRSDESIGVIAPPLARECRFGCLGLWLCPLVVLILHKVYL